MNSTDKMNKLTQYLCEVKNRKCLFFISDHFVGLEIVMILTKAC